MEYCNSRTHSILSIDRTGVLSLVAKELSLLPKELSLLAKELSLLAN